MDHLPPILEELIASIARKKAGIPDDIPIEVLTNLRMINLSDRELIMHHEISVALGFLAVLMETNFDEYLKRAQEQPIILESKNGCGCKACLSHAFYRGQFLDLICRMKWFGKPSFDRICEAATQTANELRQEKQSRARQQKSDVSPLSPKLSPTEKEHRNQSSPES